MLKTSELLKIFSEPNYVTQYTHSKAANSCIRCGMPAHAFRDAYAKLEYAISALCQNCQDELLNERTSLH
jgi:hypothetical protein